MKRKHLHQCSRDELRSQVICLQRKVMAMKLSSIAARATAVAFDLEVRRHWSGKEFHSWLQSMGLVR